MQIAGTELIASQQQALLPSATFAAAHQHSLPTSTDLSSNMLAVQDNRQPRAGTVLEATSIPCATTAHTSLTPIPYTAGVAADLSRSPALLSSTVCPTAVITALASSNKPADTTAAAALPVSLFQSSLVALKPGQVCRNICPKASVQQATQVLMMCINTPGCGCVKAHAAMKHRSQ